MLDASSYADQVASARLNHPPTQPWPEYEPCECEGACGKDCTCLDSKNFCEKFCGCDSSCTFRFQGCECKGGCRTKACPCHAAGASSLTPLAPVKLLLIGSSCCRMPCARIACKSACLLSLASHGILLKMPGGNFRMLQQWLIRRPDGCMLHFNNSIDMTLSCNRCLYILFLQHSTRSGFLVGHV